MSATQRKSAEAAAARRVWLSYDLGVGGPYRSLYEWLDAQGAKECGDSVATFKTSLSLDSIGKEVKTVLGSHKGKIYLIDPKSGKGRFVTGRRGAAPWAGYAEVGDELEDE